MDYSILENSEPENPYFEVNHIILNDKTYDIGTLYFFPLIDGKEKYPESSDLHLGEQVHGIGLMLGLAELYNFSDEEIQIVQMNPRHFSEMIQNISVNIKGKPYILEKPNKSPPIPPHEKVDLKVAFNEMNETDNYHIYYFSPTITYTKEDNTQYTADGNYFAYGLLLSKRDFITILMDMNLIKNPYIL